jgi:hypothetical protein
VLALRIAKGTDLMPDKDATERSMREVALTPIVTLNHFTPAMAIITIKRSLIWLKRSRAVEYV